MRHFVVSPCVGSHPKIFGPRVGRGNDIGCELSCCAHVARAMQRGDGLLHRRIVEATAHKLQRAVRSEGNMATVALASMPSRSLMA